MRTLFPLLATTLVACMPTPSTDARSGDSIIGGANTSGDPSVVSLQLADGSGDCTATVIAPRVLLTAAHCVDVAQRYRAAWGPNDASPQQVVQITETHADPAFDGGNWESNHDIAVAILASDAPTPALRIASGALSSSMVGSNVRLVGYGVSATDQTGAGTKREITLPVVALTANHIQVGSPGRTACHGDSGGPMFARIGGQEMIVGTTSYGDDDYCESGVAYYLRIDVAMPFLRPYLEGTAPIGMGSTGPASAMAPAQSGGGKPDDGAGGGSDPGGGGDKPSDPGAGGGDKGGCDPYWDPGCK